VTLAGLVKYVQEVVPKRVGIDLGSSNQERPFAVVEGYKADELVIAVTGQPNPVPRTEVQMAPSVNDKAIELNFWEKIKNSSDPKDFKSYQEKYPNGTFSKLAANRLNGIETAHRRTKGDTGQKKTEQLENSFTDFILSQGFKVISGIPLLHASDGSLYISPNGVEFKVTGKNPNPQYHFSISCADIIKFGRRGLGSHSAFHIESRNKKYDFVTFEDRNLILEAVSQSCGHH
jgi:hypothetical protein